MKLSTSQELARLNQLFYAEHAENFADARPRLPAGVQRVLAVVPAGARALEVGCGDGKVGRALARAGVAAYVGLDSSEALLDRARKYTTEASFAGLTPLGGRGQATNGADGASVLRRAMRSFVFISADLTSPAWAGVIEGASFDWILAFAVFHHLPGYDLRASVLETLARHLAPGGRVALSNWQFTRSERLKKRIVPWATAGIADDDVEPGDYLLSWERKGTHGLRYVHVLDELEARRMAANAELRVVETFSADGVTGDLSEYVVLQNAY